MERVAGAERFFALPDQAGLLFRVARGAVTFFDALGDQLRDLLAFARGDDGLEKLPDRALALGVSEEGSERFAAALPLRPARALPSRRRSLLASSARFFLRLELELESLEPHAGEVRVRLVSALARLALRRGDFTPA